MMVKVCGLRSVEDVGTAEAAGADAIGFVFAESVRRIEPSAAAEACRATRLKRVAVMKHPSQALLDEVIDVFTPDVVQTDADDFDGLRLPDTVERWPVYREGGAAAPTSGTYLYEGPKSGSGQTVDWRTAAEVARHGNMLLAGGLSPANVRDAIAAVAPWGVDVSSGIESSPGVKDPDKIHAFVNAARAAARTA